MKQAFADATVGDIDQALKKSRDAFQHYKLLSLKERASFLRRIAEKMEEKKSAILEIAQQETHLSEERLRIEFTRTKFQLTSYADACEEGTWLDLRIDTEKDMDGRIRPDLRKMMVPLGPVVVFGASNFPFAYSTAGGDTACALAAGCTVIIKAHPAHGNTSEMIASCINEAASDVKLPNGIFIHLHGAGFEAGKALVMHPLTKAVGFTGSVEGGRALYDLACQRSVPIPVFAEMGSVNPVFLLSGRLKSDVSEWAVRYAQSITQSAGQFCTNPGLLIGIISPELESFKKALGERIGLVEPETMLHSGIAHNFHKRREEVLTAEGVTMLSVASKKSSSEESMPTLAVCHFDAFIANPTLHQEVFGPFSLLVECEHKDQLLQLAAQLEGQLTCTIIANEKDLQEYTELMPLLREKAGRIILNGVPTGVEVALSMQHGGPYPATTDSRFTAVGADGIRRFARPVCYQGWPDKWLPEELRNGNPLQIWRTVNDELTRKGW